jgi:hypothetical protein
VVSVGGALLDKLREVPKSLPIRPNHDRADDRLDAGLQPSTGDSSPFDGLGVEEATSLTHHAARVRGVPTVRFDDLPFGFQQHADKHRSKRPVLLAVDQQFADGWRQLVTRRLRQSHPQAREPP